MTRPFLITGCGRSGTGWAAALFTALGYPCGHEQVYDVNGPGLFTRPDSSWLAVPHAPRTPPGTPILRVVRDPYLVVQSVMARGFLAYTDGEYERYVTRHMPSIIRPNTHLGRAIRWVALWDTPLDAIGHMVLHVDLVGIDDLCLAVQVATGDGVDPLDVIAKQAMLGQRINTNLNPWGAMPSREDIMAHRDAPLLAHRAERFGYGG